MYSHPHIPYASIQPFITLFDSILDTRPAKQNNTIQHTRMILALKSLYPNSIFTPVDHNAKQPACVCPIRLHHALCELYTLDTKHFRILKPGDSFLKKRLTQSDFHTQIHKAVRAKVSKAWLKRLSKGVKSHGILYLIPKLDGIRFRMSGSCAALAHDACSLRTAPQSSRY